MSAQALTEPGDNAPAWKIGTLLKGALDSLVPAFWRLVYIDSPATDRDDDSAPSSRMIGLFEEFGNIWPLHAVPNGIFADRGPARSIAALQALCEELKLTKAAPPAQVRRALSTVLLSTLETIRFTTEWSRVVRACGHRFRCYESSAKALCEEPRMHCFSIWISNCT